MDTQPRSRWKIQEIPFSVFMLVVLIFFSYGIFAHIPYLGFYFDPNTGHILQVFNPSNSRLRPGDILSQVGDISFSEYKEISTQALFPNSLKKGDVVLMEVERNGEKVNLNWEMPGFNPIEFRGRLFNIYWLAYIFWFFGAVIEMYVRPRETRWRLLLTANHLTGVWLMMGALSSWRLWGSSVLFHSLTWLLPPLYLHLHWIFPRPIYQLPKITGILIYTTFGLAALAEFLNLLPKSFYLLALVLSFGGSPTLLILHFLLRREQRRQIRMLALSTVLAILPLLFVVITGLNNTLPAYAPVSLVFLVFIPSIYMYLILQNQLGELETRVNRYVSTFAYLILASLALIAIALVTASAPSEITTLLGFVVPLLVAAFSSSQFPKFERFIEMNFLGIQLPYKNLPETYSSHIATCEDLPSLLSLLENEVFPSLLVRQYAFLQTTDKHLTTLLTKDISHRSFNLDSLTQNAGRYLPNLSPQDGWLRLILPLKVGDATLGFWLLGKRDPDDLYPQIEIPILQSLADQTAIALSNILTNEKLLKLYQADIKRSELERQNLAHELHDNVLNQLALLHNSLNENTLPPGFLNAYEELKRRLREIVTSLRPPMLTYGLALAITDLAESLMERSAGTLKVIVNLQASEERLPESIEAHFYRIVQEACENVLRHAQASQITISGSLSPTQAELRIEDNGKGFKAETQFELNELLAQNHFGLAGMKERAHLIGATIEFKSQPQAGTHVNVRWAYKE